MTVEELLKQRDIYFIPKGADYLVSCLNPEHADRNPSMRIDNITGIYQCFSCEFKGNVFTHFGEKANQLQLRRELLKRKIKDKRSESIGLSFPKNVMPYVGNWREIKPETYKRFEAFQHADADYVGRINFPIRDISGRIVAFNGRHTTGGTPKYMISPAGAKMPLFPIVEPIQGKVILVEGIYDMLNLQDKGLTNAVCTFGVDSIDVFFDGDDAGQDAAIKVKEMCEQVGLAHRNICLKNTDPGALKQQAVETLKRKLYG